MKEAWFGKAVLTTRVWTNRGEAHSEGAGRLAFAHAALGQRLDDLLPEVLRVCVHQPMMSDGSATLQAAVDPQRRVSQHDT